MRVFLTGGTGYIGSAVVDALKRGGHDVTALVRGMSSSAPLVARGAHVVTGNLADPKSLRTSAAGFDAYVHTAFESSARGPEIDRLAVEALLEMAAHNGPAVFVYTSGVWVLGSTTEPADESAPLNPTPIAAFRPAHERLVLDAARDGLRTVVVRPGLVYGGTRGIVSDLVKEAHSGLMRVIGAGDNHWPVVYDRDLGDLYARLVASPDASGVYHATDESHERVVDIVKAIARHAPSKPDVRYVPLAEARSKMGPYAEALALDQIVRSPRARALGWSPSLASLTRAVPRLFEEWRSGRNAGAA